MKLVPKELIEEFYNEYKDSELEGYSFKSINNIIKEFFVKVRFHIFSEEPCNIKLTHLGQFRIIPTVIMRIYYERPHFRNKPFIKKYIESNKDICRYAIQKLVKRAKYGDLYKKKADRFVSIYEEIYNETLDKGEHI